MSRCREHPGRKAITSELGGLCQECYDQVRRAQSTVNPFDHTGIVVKVEDVKVVVKEDGQDVEKTKQKILIQHCSSGQGRVATDDFDRHFGGKGDFYRL
ncbi:MAG: hypothetical protein FWD51_03180 [Betaproteobacteria bacterium]|nr:hypothetical protein [Betaproteobacteria bacterium]